MTISVDSRDAAIVFESKVYITSSPVRDAWGQPSLSKYAVSIQDAGMTSQLIKGMYQANIPYLPENAQNSLLNEFAAWDAASSADLKAFDDLIEK